MTINNRVKRPGPAMSDGIVQRSFCAFTMTTKRAAWSLADGDRLAAGNIVETIEKEMEFGSVDAGHCGDGEGQKKTTIIISFSPLAMPWCWLAVCGHHFGQSDSSRFVFQP